MDRSVILSFSDLDPFHFGLVDTDPFHETDPGIQKSAKIKENSYKNHMKNIIKKKKKNTLV